MKSNIKPILFNTDMVERIRSGEKTMTRRLLNPQPEGAHTVLDSDDEAHTFDLLCGNGGDGGRFVDWAETVKAPYWPGDILYVRETWRIQSAHRFEADAKIEFRAGGEMTTIRFPGGMSQSHGRDEYDQFIEKWGVGGKWHPSIFMPKEAARIFLLVNDIWPEQLQEITEDDAIAEGAASLNPPSQRHKDKKSKWVTGFCSECSNFDLHKGLPINGYCGYEGQKPHDGESVGCTFSFSLKPDDTPEPAIMRFAYLWESLNPKVGCHWRNNPWVWATKFEQISKEAALVGGIVR